MTPPRPEPGGMSRQAKMDRARSMYLMDATLDEIAAEVNRTRRTVCRWLNTMPDLPRRTRGRGNDGLNRQKVTVPHGSAGYKGPRRCRCDECRAGNAATARRWRARVRARAESVG